MKFIFFVLTFMVTTFAPKTFADIPLRFNFNGEFVPPDLILQNRAINHYKQGQLDASLNKFKRSAKFGNDMSDYMIALIYFEKKDWITGYAWLRMVDKPIDNRDQLLRKLSKLLTKNELSISNEKFESLKLTYNNFASFERRNKWQKSKTFTGSRIAGLVNIDNNNLSIDIGSHDGGLTGKDGARSPGNSTLITSKIANNSNGSSLTVNQYVQEYAYKGDVKLGEIKEK